MGEWLVRKEARTSVFMLDSSSMLEIRKKNQAFFNEIGNVVLPKCKTPVARISYPPIIQIESFFYFN